MTTIEVHIPDSRSDVQIIKERMEQQIRDAATGSDVETFEFITSTYENLCTYYV